MKARYEIFFTYRREPLRMAIIAKPNIPSLNFLKNNVSLCHPKEDTRPVKRQDVGFPAIMRFLLNQPCDELSTSEKAFTIEWHGARMEKDTKQKVEEGYVAIGIRIRVSRMNDLTIRLQQWNINSPKNPQLCMKKSIKLHKKIDWIFVYSKG